MHSEPTEKENAKYNRHMPFKKHHVLIHELKTKLMLKEVWYYCVTCLTARLTTTCVTSAGTEQVAQNFNQLLEGQAVQ